MRDGTMIAGRFAIVRLAGSGGMGAVYQARDTETGQAVALKVLRMEGEDFMARLVREANILATLAHPGIVRYVSHGMTAAGEPYLAMEWLNGEDLGARLRRGPLSVPETELIAERLCAALAVAHRKGVVHRDLKPANVFLARPANFDGDTSPDGEALGSVRHEDDLEVKLVDFGVARLTGGTTRAGLVIGTPGYMAPEQARGEQDIDARADVFALGCVIFACLTGRSPFVGDRLEAVLAKVLFEEAPRLSSVRPDVPAELDALVASMLDKDPRARPADASAVATLLRVGTQGTLGLREPPAAHPSVGTNELRFVGVLMAGASALGPRAPTAEPRAPTAEPRAPSVEPLLLAVAEQYGVRLDRLAGGELVAAFTGSAQAIDVAARGARCALALRPLLPGVPLVFAMGRGFVSENALPIGAAIDRATRLLQEIDDDQPVLVDELAAGLLELRFLLEQRSSGAALVAERDVAGAARLLLGKSTACVGRDRELASLQGLLQDCLAEPFRRAVLVTGPPGVGKSRLRHEFLRRLETGETKCDIWLGRGDPMRAGAPLAILSDTLCGPMGIVGGEDLATRRAKILERVGRHFAGEERARVSEFLGEICATPFPDEGRVQLRAARQDWLLMGDQVKRAWEDWLAAELALHPVVMVLDDLHWGDLPSLRLIDAGLRASATRPFFVLGLARPEIHELFPGLWSERSLEEIHLRELSKASCERLIRQVLGAKVAAEEVARITQASQGNPFYLEEIIRAVAEHQGGEVPETVLAMVDSRLARLPAEARQVLRAASVFGEVFWETGVGALLGGAEPDHVRRLLAEVAEREWVAPRRDSRFTGEREHGFGHALQRAAAYASLTAADLQLGHRVAGGWLESVGETNAITLAEHFDRGGDAARAAVWWTRAAEQALAGNDFVAALAHAARAARLGASGETLGRLRLIEAEAHGWRAEHAAAEPCAAEAMALLPRGGDLWANAVHHLAWALRLLDKGEALADLATVLEGVFLGSPTPLLIIGMCATAIKLIEVGGYAEANRLLDHVEATELLKQPAQPLVSAWVANARAYRMSVTGDSYAMLGFLRGSIAHWDAAGDQRNACFARANTGYACIELGAHEEAERELRAAIATAERLALQPVVDAARQNLGWALALQGRLDEARVEEERSAAAFHARGDRRLEGISLVYLALIDVASGDVDGAARACAEALEHSTPAQRAYALAAHAHLLLRRGTPAEALAPAAEAMGILEGLGGLDIGDAFVRVTHAEALWQTGAAEHARAAIGAARDRLLARADRITESTWRDSFLHNIPESARTLARAEEWSVPAGPG